MNFAEAMRMVLEGKSVRRDDWHRPLCIEKQTREEMPFIAMVMHDGRTGPYSPSHCDMLADDWREL